MPVSLEDRFKIVVEQAVFYNKGRSEIAYRASITRGDGFSADTDWYPMPHLARNAGEMACVAEEERVSKEDIKGVIKKAK